MARLVSFPSQTWLDHNGPIVRGEEYEATLQFDFDISGYTEWAAQVRPYATSGVKGDLELTVDGNDLSVLFPEEVTAMLGDGWVCDIEAIPPGKVKARTIFSNIKVLSQGQVTR